jgi:hypothetical protein
MSRENLEFVCLAFADVGSTRDGVEKAARPRRTSRACRSPWHCRGLVLCIVGTALSMCRLRLALGLPAPAEVPREVPN